MKNNTMKKALIVAIALSATAVTLADEEKHEQHGKHWHNGDHATDFYYGSVNSSYQWLDEARASDIGISVRLGDTVFLQAEASSTTDLKGNEVKSGSRWAAGARFPIADFATVHAIWDHHRFAEQANHAGIEAGLVLAYNRVFAAGTARANLTLPDTSFIGGVEAGLRFDDWLAVSGFSNYQDDDYVYGVRGRVSFGLD